MRNFKAIQDILGALPDIKRIYLMGCTGTGKTSLVQHIIGSKKHGFPVTTHSRTTIAPTEYVIKKGLPFKTTIILKKKQDIEYAIEDLIQGAILKAKENESSLEDIVFELELSPDQRFKLSQMVTPDTFRNIAEAIQNRILPTLIKKEASDETLFSEPLIKEATKNIVDDVLREIEKNFTKTCGKEHQLFSDEPIIIEGMSNKDDFITKNNKYQGVSQLDL